MSDKPPISSHKDLLVWQKAIDLTEDCYRATTDFPAQEVYGLTSQIRRAAVSIVANIAEGYGRDQTGSFIQFLRVALGSVRELDTHFMITQRVNLMRPEQCAPLVQKCDEISKMPRSLIRSLEARNE